MKLVIKTMALLAIFSLLITSCNKNESPVITIHELGYDNTKTVVAGNDLHIDAEIVASQKIASIQLIIHSEAEHADAPAQKAKSGLNTATEWEVDTTYTTKFYGLKNAIFHEHINVPATAALGHYHVHIKVTDMEGNQTVKEDEIEVLGAKL